MLLMYNIFMSEVKEEKKDEVDGNFSEKTLFSWKAQSRPFKKLTKEQWTKIIVFCAFLGLILFIAEGVIPVLLTIAVVFFFYILSTVEPEKIGYEITTKGIKIAGKLTPWDQIYRFWFGESLGSRVLVLETRAVASRMNLVIEVKDVDSIRKNLLKYLPEEESPASGVDKLSGWFSKKVLKA